MGNYYSAYHDILAEFWNKMREWQENWRIPRPSLDSLESTSFIKKLRAGNLFGRWYQKIQVKIQNWDNEGRLCNQECTNEKKLSV